MTPRVPLPPSSRAAGRLRCFPSLRAPGRAPRWLSFPLPLLFCLPPSPNRPMGVGLPPPPPPPPPRPRRRLRLPFAVPALVSPSPDPCPRLRTTLQDSGPCFSLFLPDRGVPGTPFCKLLVSASSSGLCGRSRMVTGKECSPGRLGKGHRGQRGRGAGRFGAPSPAHGHTAESVLAPRGGRTKTLVRGFNASSRADAAPRRSLGGRVSVHRSPSEDVCS